MPNFWQRLFKLQNAVENSSPSVPAIHELIQRSAEEEAAYTAWKESYILRQMRQWVREEFDFFSQNGSSGKLEILICSVISLSALQTPTN